MIRNRQNRLSVAYFIHLWPVLAVCLLFLNDRFLKYAFPGWWTGKLSDFAGVFFLPLYLCALCGLVMNFLVLPKSKFFWIYRREVLIAIALTDLVFIALKLWPPANAAYLQVMSEIGVPSRLVMDPWDLTALIMNVPTYLHARRFFSSQA